MKFSWFRLMAGIAGLYWLMRSIAADLNIFSFAPDISAIGSAIALAFLLPLIYTEGRP